jgi:hypothetical protein
MAALVDGLKEIDGRWPVLKLFLENPALLLR